MTNKKTKNKINNIHKIYNGTHQEETTTKHEPTKNFFNFKKTKTYYATHQENRTTPQRLGRYN